MTSVKNIKVEYACVMCNMIPKSPITFLCDCWACKAHLSDHFVKEGKIMCTKCKKEFKVSNKEDFKEPQKMLQSVLNNELYLNEHEREAKLSFHCVIDRFKQKWEMLIAEKQPYEVENYDHFRELRRQIDIQKEKLIRDTTQKTEEVWLILIDKTKEVQAAFQQKLKNLDIVQIDFDKERELINDEFRKLDLSIERIEALKSAQEQQIKLIEAKLKSVKKLKQQIKSCSFKAAECNFASSSFGMLDINYLKQKLISCSRDQTIKIWDLQADQCTKTLNGHTKMIWCIEKVSDNQVLSCSSDESIKRWNLDSGLCARTYLGHANEVICLKMLNGNSFASGSLKQIKIWDLSNGSCIKTLKGHKDFVRSLVLLPNRNLISCAQDKTIKVWDLEQGLCIKTLVGHTESVFHIILLHNGNLASASADYLVKIWNF